MIVIGLVVGIVATVVSGFVPARRATRVEPVAAMRDSVTPGVGTCAGAGSSSRWSSRRSASLLLLYGLLGDPGDAPRPRSCSASARC